MCVLTLGAHSVTGKVLENNNSGWLIPTLALGTASWPNKQRKTENSLSWSQGYSVSSKHGMSQNKPFLLSCFVGFLILRMRRINNAHMVHEVVKTKEKDGFLDAYDLPEWSQNKGVQRSIKGNKKVQVLRDCLPNSTEIWKNLHQSFLNYFSK